MKSGCAILLLVSALFLGGCQDEKVWPEVDIEFLQPLHTVYYQVPAQIPVHLKITSAREVKMVKVSIDDLQHNSIMQDFYTQPEAKETEISTILRVDYISDSQAGPFHLHIAVDDGEAIYHELWPINLEDAAVVADGFYLFTKPDQHRMNVLEVHPDLSHSLFLSLSGTYLGSVQLPKEARLLVASSDIGRLDGFDTREPSLSWSVDADMPRPQYSSFLADYQWIYVGTANGRILAFDPLTGGQKMSTAVVRDSIPQCLGITNNYLVGDFKSLNGGHHTWLTFYKETGERLHRFATTISVTHFFPLATDDRLLVFGNQGDYGVVGQYIIETNILHATRLLDIEINRVVQQSAESYLIAAANAIYAYDLHTNNLTELFLTPSEIVSLAYDRDREWLYVALPDAVHIYTTTGFYLLASMAVEEPVTGVKLRYLYQNTLLPNL